MKIRQLAIASCVFTSLGTAQGTRADAARIARDVAVLADDKWEGRATCTPGIDSAAAFIAQRFQSLRLKPVGAATSMYHRYTARPDAHFQAGVVSCDAKNVAAILTGSDASLAEEFVIVGAHYDHLGRSSVGALDPGSTDSIRNGADDNASGTAAVMELARIFAANPAKRSIIFVAFSGEEWGLLGSDKFASEALPRGRAHAMVNFDMVGRLRDDKLLVYGVGTAAELRGIADRANSGTPFRITYDPSGYGPSDHTSFYTKNMPVLHMFTDVHDDYHKASDHADKINAAGEARVVDYAARVIREIADHATPLTFVEQQRPAPVASSGTRPYLGSVPDMAGGDTPGLRLSGVTPGSPAAKGGLLAGDIVVEIAGLPVTDLTSYSTALYAKKPGDTIDIVVVRDGKRLKLSVTLTTRGS